MNKLELFIKENREDMLTDLTDIVKDLKEAMQSDPEEYTDYGCEDPSIDVRLCIDLDRSKDSWIIRTGSSDYDQYHSDFCAASCIGLDTDAKKLLQELIDSVIEDSYQ
jgi:hypothetical protein